LVVEVEQGGPRRARNNIANRVVQALGGVRLIHNVGEPEAQDNAANVFHPIEEV